MQMKIHGSFINRLGDTVAVEITTRTGGAADMEIGTEEAGLWFDADAPVAIRAEANGPDDVLLRHSCTIRLLSRSFVPSLFCASCLDAVAMVSSNGRCVFAGYIEPMAYSQPFAEALDTLEINCIDALSALQYFRYGGAGSPDVSFEALKRAARQRSFAHVIKAAIGGVAAGLGGGVRLLYDGSRAIGSDTGAGVLSRLAVSELLFLGDTEDDAWGMDEVVSETLRYLDLHIVQQGTDFLVFSWQTLKAGGGERTIAWHDLGGGSPLAATHRTHAITAATAWGTSAQVSIGEVFSQVLLTCKTTGDGRIIESPLDSKAMAPAYPRRQKYMTTYRSGGEGSTALTAFRAMLMGKGTEYDAAKVTEWYVQVMDAPSWTFYTYDGGRSDMMGLTADGRHQERVAQRLGRAPGAALLSVGQCAVDVAGKDNSPTSPSMSACLVLSIPLSSPGVTGEARAAADMACDWGSLGVGKDGVPLRARVSMRVATDGGCRLRVGLEGSGVDVEAVDVEAGGWLTVAIGGTGGVALRRAPSELVVALERGECRVTDIQVVPDVAVMVGTRLTQTADGIAMLVGGMAKGLQATDIDIANRKLTVTADSFMVRNNKGEATAAVDADGNLVAGSLKAGGRAYFANRMDGGYDIRYEVGVRVTNRQLAQVTFTPGGHLGCYIQKSRTEQSAWVALAQKEAVAIASGASGVVTFSGASTVGGSHGAAPAVPFSNGDTLDVRLCYKGEGRGVGLVTCGLEA